MKTKVVEGGLSTKTLPTGPSKKRKKKKKPSLKPTPKNRSNQTRGFRASPKKKKTPERKKKKKKKPKKRSRAKKILPAYEGGASEALYS